MSILSKIINILPQAQRAAASKILSIEKKFKKVNTPRQEIEVSNELLDLIKGKEGQKVFTPILAGEGDRISSKDHNLNMRSIFIDLNTIYSQLALMGKGASEKSASLRSEYLKSKAAIQKLISDARNYALRKKFPEYSEVHIIDFDFSKNVSKTRPTAPVDDKTNVLRSRPISDTRAHIQARGARSTKVSVNILSSGAVGELSSKFPPSAMIDQKPETFWVATVLSDSKEANIYTPIEGKNVEYDGVLVEIDLEFSLVEQLNYIKILPFGEYPTDVVALYYKPSHSSKSFRKIDIGTLDSTLNWVEIYFNKIFAAGIKILLGQKNYNRNIYSLPRELVVNTDLFNFILEDREKDISSTIFIDNLQDIESTSNAFKDAIEDLERLISNIDLEKSRTTEIDLVESLQSAIGHVLDEIGESGRLILKTILEKKDKDLISVEKYEYILGVREIETGYELVAPVSYFESDPYLPQATVSEVSIETDENHLPVETSWGTYYPTSIEWYVDLGSTELPIHPINRTGQFGIPTALDEKIDFDRFSLEGTTLHGGNTEQVLALKRNGDLIPPDKYTVERLTESIPRLKIKISEDDWDENSIYTVDYEVARSSYVLDVITNLSPTEIEDPETFNGLGPDKDIVLENYPYIRYDLINLTGNFIKEENESSWKYKPPVDNIASGQLRVYPTVLDNLSQIITSGSPTAITISGVWGSRSGDAPYDVSQLLASGKVEYFNHPDGFKWYVKVQDSSTPVNFTGVQGNNTLLLSSPPEFFSGEILSMPSGALSGFDTAAMSGYIEVDFVLGVGLDAKDKIFVFDNSIYTPIEVTVGGQKALNITNYATLEHPAFKVANKTDREYQFIHAGRRLYFNQDVGEATIKVSYEWLTKHLQVKGRLRCNKNINPDTTPTVSEIRVLMNTSIL